MIFNMSGRNFHVSNFPYHFLWICSHQFQSRTNPKLRKWKHILPSPWGCFLKIFPYLFMRPPNNNNPICVGGRTHEHKKCIAGGIKASEGKNRISCLFICGRLRPLYSVEVDDVWRRSIFISRNIFLYLLHVLKLAFFILGNLIHHCLFASEFFLNFNRSHFSFQSPEVLWTIPIEIHITLAHLVITHLALICQQLKWHSLG